jgi:hypothetical protein
MPKSKVDKSRKDKLNNYKKQHKKSLIMQENQLNLPEVREVPTWAADQKIEVTGKEFELLYNFVTSVGDAHAAAQSIMSRNILNGNIQMSFEKLVKTDNGDVSYEKMSPEESAPKQAEYQKLIDSILAQQVRQDAEETFPSELTLVNEEGVPLIQA